MSSRDVYDVLDEAEALCDKATPGPWEWSPDYPPAIRREGGPTVLTVGTNDWKDLVVHCKEGDREFIARARRLVPELVEELRQALEKIDAIQERP